MNITVIDKHTGESQVCSKVKAAKIVGVTSITIYRWSLKPNHVEYYNQFIIAFKTTIHIQKKGFAIKQPNKIKII
jgi:hypothetical protein